MPVINTRSAQQSVRGAFILGQRAFAKAASDPPPSSLRLVGSTAWKVGKAVGCAATIAAGFMLEDYNIRHSGGRGLPPVG